MSGWIKLHRQIMESDLWISEPFDRGKAWVDMIMLANHKSGYIRSNGMKIAVERGQLGWSEIRLGERWGWSRGKVRRFLSELEHEQMIVQQKDRRKSLVTICNYNEFQGIDNSCSTTDSTTDGQETDKRRYTNKNVKNEKKSNGAENGKRFTPPTQTEVVGYMGERGLVNGVAAEESDKFVDFYSSKGWMVGKNKMKDWKAAVRNWTKGMQKPQQQEFYR